MRPLRLAVALLVGALGATRLTAEEPPGAPAPGAAAEAALVDPAHVEAALVESGAHRPELEKVLAHFGAQGGGPRLVAARFLIANMPGKGHVVTALKDAKGNVLPYDPLAFPDFEAALQAYEALEKRHGPIDFARDRLVADLVTLPADFLIQHVEQAVAAWSAAPPARRVGFRAFLDHVLPYRGSEEPAEAWLSPLRARLEAAPGRPAGEASAAELWGWIQREVGGRVRFDERYYLHPTDQGFAEMERTGMGRCEDITNMTTYAARSLGLATAADYTPAWGHRDNNHAWNVLLDAQGRGSDPAQAHAAKVYRKTYALQRDALPYRLPPGREAPNRFLASKSQVDVTAQYAPTSDVTVALDPAAAGTERFAYLCVFNGGEWTAVAWAPVVGEAGAPEATFPWMGRGSQGLLYLPAVHDGSRLVPAAPPLLLHRDGSVSRLAGRLPGVALSAADVSPPVTSPDTHVTTPTVRLSAGTAYRLQTWKDGAWVTLREVEAAGGALSFEGLPADGLYWLVARESRRLERPFTIREGLQRFW